MGETDFEITELLQQWGDGDLEAFGQVISLLFDDLRELARRFLDRESPGHTLQPTALVHELYLRLADRRSVAWRNREHFFGSAAELIRRILVDHARRRLAAKRGAGGRKISLDEGFALGTARPAQLLALDDALSDLERLDPRQYRIVTLKYFFGLTWEEIAEIVEISRATVERQWRLARMWLLSQLSEAGELA